MLYLTLFIISFFWAVPNRYSENFQTDYFEGTITYKSFTRDENGKLVESKILGNQEHFFKDTFYKYNMQLKGGLADLSFAEIIVNTQDSSRYRIDHLNKTAESLGMERVSEAYLPIEIKFLHNQDTLLGYSCIKYEMLQLDFYTQAPLKSYVWIAEGISVKNLPLLGRIFGYQNSLIKDGSLNGLALRYESEGTLNSDALVIQATEVNPIILEKSAFEVPPMYLRE